MKALHAIRGMNDILPSDATGWQRVEAVFRRRATLSGYGEVRTPLIEDTQLFARQIGETTDVVEKEMYSFDRHGDSLTVRPEGTAGAARAYVEHGVAHKQPVTKWYYVGPMFRGERPAKGRYRQFHQAGCELYGDPGPICDAEMIRLVVDFFEDLGIGGLTVHVNSLGSGDTRDRYRAALLDHFRPHAKDLSDDSQRRLERNPLRILDSKEPRDQAIAAGAPSILDVLTAEDRAHFDRVLEALKVLDVSYVVDNRLVRGLDYYTRTLFEVRTSSGDLGAQNALGGGGRYDGMIESLGGPKVPAIGFAAGIERLLMVMQPDARSIARPPIVVAALSTDATATALRFARDLRARDVPVELDARDARVKSVIRRAEAVGARWLVLIGDDEVVRGEVSMKDLALHRQEALKIADALRILSGANGQPPPNREPSAPMGGD